MLRRICLILVGLIVVVSLLELVWEITPLEQLMALFSGKVRPGRGSAGGATLIRLGIASWQMDEFPWQSTLRKYEQAHGGKIRIHASSLPEGSFNSMQAFWRFGHTSYDVVVAWADEEIHPFINYKWNSRDPSQRSLIINVRDYLTAEQLDSFVPALFGGSSRKDPDTGRTNLYELPWMGEVLALNYNRKFFRARGIEQIPSSWQEVERACEKLKGLEHEGVKVAPLAMNFSQTVFFGQNCYIPMLAAFRKGRGVADEKGRLDVSSPEAVRVFETLKRWYSAGYISRNAMVNDAVEHDLRAQRAAMFAHWQSRGLAAVRDHGPEAIGIAPTPGAKQSGTLVSTYGCIIPKCSPVIREAVEFCYEAFCTDTYGFQTAVAKSGKMPATRETYERKDLPPGIGELGRSLHRGYSFPDQVNWTQCADILVVEFQRYLVGDVATADEALANVRRRFAEEVYAGK